ncbi:MAG: 4-hydroxy-3-methylbut-2-enyl diphosphate reductase [Clostridia bacterium]|nr:4-hydroxy-3-methylbut-2-enyl diphosphate reductase [Clostridia bacterium]
MEIVVGKTAGFCYGVKNAVDKATEELKKSSKVCCLGEIVHNSKVVKNLEENGIKFIEDLSQNTDKSKTIIRAHGVQKAIYEKAKQDGIELVDLTCPKVLKIHKIVSEYANKDYFTFLIGNKVHPETLGTASFCGDYSCVIEHEDDIGGAIDNLKLSDKKNLLVVVQTTFSIEKFNKYIDIIKSEIDNGIHLDVINTICNATKIRQEETEEMSKQVDFMIIIGGKNSSNTKKLYEISCKDCQKVICIEDKSEIDLSNFDGVNKVGIMAGASTPQKSVDDVVNLLKNT